MAAAFAVSKYDDGHGTSRLMVTGEIDEDTSGALATVIVNAASQRCVWELVVDLGHVTFLAAAGVRALLRGQQAAQARGCAYRVAGAHGIVREVLRMSGAEMMFELTAPAPHH